MAVVTERAEPQLAVPDEAIRPQPEPKPTARAWIYAAGILLIVAAAVTFIQALSRFTAAPPLRAVTASGRIEGREVTVAPKDIQGRVKRLLVDEGETVKQGQLLAELEAEALEARVRGPSPPSSQTSTRRFVRRRSTSAYTAKNSDASIAAAEAGRQQRAGAHRARERHSGATRRPVTRAARRCSSDGVISKQEFDQVEMALRTSEADVDAAEKELARAHANLRSGTRIEGHDRRETTAGPCAAGKPPCRRRSIRRSAGESRRAADRRAG